MSCPQKLHVKFTLSPFSGLNHAPYPCPHNIHAEVLAPSPSEFVFFWK